MLNLDQIKQLEARVSKAIELMQTLKDEKDVHANIMDAQAVV